MSNEDVAEIAPFDYFQIGIKAPKKSLDLTYFLTQQDLIRSKNDKLTILLTMDDETIEDYIAISGACKNEMYDWVKNEGRIREIYIRLIESHSPYAMLFKIPKTWFPAERAVIKAFKTIGKKTDLEIDMIARPNELSLINYNIWRTEQ